MGHLEVSAHMTVRPGCLEAFKKQAAELVRITKEKDTRTLRYDWFLSTDGTECEVREAYTGPEGLVEHNRNILDARTTLFKDYADNHFMTVYGEPSQVGHAEAQAKNWRQGRGSQDLLMSPMAHFLGVEYMIAWPAQIYVAFHAPAREGSATLARATSSPRPPGSPAAGGCARRA